MFLFSKKIAAIAAASLLTASSAAVAQSAQPLSLANSPTIERSGADVGEGSELRRGGIILPIVVVAIVLAILALTDTWPFDEDDPPESP